MDMAQMLITAANQAKAADDEAKQAAYRQQMTSNVDDLKAWAQGLVSRGNTWLDQANAVAPKYIPLAGGDYDRLEAAYKQPGESAANQGYQIASRDLNQAMGGRGLYGSSLMSTAANEGLNRQYMDSLANNASQATLNRYNTQQGENRFLYGTQAAEQNRKDQWAQNFLNQGNGLMSRGFDMTNNNLTNWLAIQNANAQADASRSAMAVGNFNNENNKYNAMLTAQRDAKAEQDANNQAGPWKLGGTIAGTAIGAYFGGPMGASIGGSLGGSLGTAIGGGGGQSMQQSQGGGGGLGGLGMLGGMGLSSLFGGGSSGGSGGGGGSMFGSFPGLSNAKSYLSSSGWGSW